MSVLRDHLRHPRAVRTRPINHGVRDVLAHMDAAEAGIPTILERVAQLHAHAEAVAAEHGHRLGPWYFNPITC